MELNIFTKEQQQFIKDNYAEFDRAERLSRKIHGSEDTGDLSKAELMGVLGEYRDRILNDRKPFEDYNAVYNGKKAEVLHKHGYEPDDFYDTEVIDELIEVQKQMREDAEAFGPDMKSPKKEKSQLASMFDDYDDEKVEQLEYQYK